MKMITDKYISVVVACYRDEGSVEELLRRLTATMEKVTPNWEVIYVNDDSPDNAESILLKQAESNPRLTVISHARNFGAQAAFTTGMMQASGDAVIIMDGDLQDPPELIEEFVKKWQMGNEVVYGIRGKRHENFVRNIAYKLFYRLFRKISYLPIPLDAGEFSLMDRVVVDVVINCPEYDRLIRGLRAYAGFKQTGIRFERPKRFAGESTQSFFDYLMWAYKSFTSFSLAPLRFITVSAFSISFVLMVMVIFYIVAFIRNPDTPKGYMTLLLLTISIGATIMMSLGVIGEYLGRLFLEIKNRPHRVIRCLKNDHREQPRDWLGRTEVRTPVTPPEETEGES